MSLPARDFLPQPESTDSPYQRNDFESDRNFGTSGIPRSRQSPPRRSTDQQAPRKDPWHSGALRLHETHASTFRTAPPVLAVSEALSRCSRSCRRDDSESSTIGRLAPIVGYT